MNGYICFYNGNRIEVRADTLLQASEKAVQEFQKQHPRRRLKPWSVTTVLAERADGSAVIHDATSLPGA